jgi:transposase
LHRLGYCRDCLKKQQEIDRLREENARLKDRLRYQERTAKEGAFGSATPSSQVPIKPSAPLDPAPRFGGARPGHAGHGRDAIPPEQAEQVRQVSVPELCPQCGRRLETKGAASRTVLDVQPLRRRTVCYQLDQKYCSHCHKLFRAAAPGVLPRALLSNRLLAHVAVQHYVYGVTLGQLAQQLDVGGGTLVGALHQVARRLQPACEQLVEDYRKALVKHADETGWRTDGRNGYAWLFCTETISIFRFRQSRSGQVALQVLGTKRLRGVLVVDRYKGYNRAPCALQYCYAHLLRDTEDLEKEFPEQAEIRQFASAFAPLLARAMQLRAMPLTEAEFRLQADRTQQEIQALVQGPAQHPGIQEIQNIFREQAQRLYHWAKSPKIPADNNRAERELRPLVIARKISFGSQSKDGARTRETLMTVLHTLRKRTANVTAAFEQALNRLSDEKMEPYPALGFDSS